MREKKKANYRDSPFYKLLRFIVKNFIVKYYRVEFINSELLDEMEAPYIVLPNHCSFYDPFFINTPIYEKIHYIVSDAQFRNPVQKRLLALTGAIPIVKNTNDLNSLKKMTQASKEGKIIGIFPEGKRNWVGATLPVIESTAKLVRMLNIPIVVPLMEGGYLMNPRWGKSFRRGRVYITYHLLFNGEKPGRKKVSEIVDALNKTLRHNEFMSPKLQGQRFKSGRRAEKIEQVIYLCPECHSISSFHSKGNNFSCRKCGYSVHYQETGWFKALSGKEHFENLYQWNTWQVAEAKKLIEGSEEAALLFSDENLTLAQPDDTTGKLIRKGTGILSFYKNRMEFLQENREKLVFELEDIKGINIQQHERLEFYHNRELYCFYNKDKTFSAFKVNEFYDLIMAAGNRREKQEK